MTRLMTFFCLLTVAVTLVLLLLSCNVRGVSSGFATATYGAEQWHIQLTAQAERAQRGVMP